MYLKSYHSTLPLLLITAMVMLSAFSGAALHQGVSASAGLDVLSIFRFVQEFLAGSVSLGIFVAIVVNLFKPKLPDGYADTFSTIVTIVTLSLVFIAKALFANLTLFGLEQLFDDLTKYSPLWIPVLAWIIRYISGEANTLLTGIPFIGYSHTHGSLGSPGLTQRE